MALPGIDTFALNPGCGMRSRERSASRSCQPLFLNVTGYYQSYKNINDVVIGFFFADRPHLTAAGVVVRLCGADHPPGQRPVVRHEFMPAPQRPRHRLDRLHFELRRARVFVRPASRRLRSDAHAQHGSRQVRLPWNFWPASTLRVHPAVGTQLKLPDGSGTLRNNVRLPTTVLTFVWIGEWLFRRFALIVFLEAVVNATFSEAVFGLAYPKRGSDYALRSTDGKRLPLIIRRSASATVLGARRKPCAQLDPARGLLLWPRLFIAPVAASSSMTCRGGSVIGTGDPTGPLRR